MASTTITTSSSMAAADPHVDRLAGMFDGFGYPPGKSFAARGVEVEVWLVATLLDELAALGRRLGVPADSERARAKIVVKDEA